MAARPAMTVTGPAPAGSEPTGLAARTAAPATSAPSATARAAATVVAADNSRAEVTAQLVGTAVTGLADRTGLPVATGLHGVTGVGAMAATELVEGIVRRVGTAVSGAPTDPPAA